MSEPSGFAAIAGALDYPMAIVTAAAGGEQGGCLVGFHTQCSIDPPRYVVLVSVQNHTYRVAQQAAALGVHILDESERGLATHFGGLTGDEVDKFAGVRWHEGRDGVPVLSDARARFVGRIVEWVATGDHAAFFLDVLDGHLDPPLHPLGFQQVKDLDPGHEA